MNNSNNGLLNSLLFIIFLLLIITCGILSSAFAADILQRVEFPSSPNPVGSGARAIGMGGAFIAVADDATSASWNPGGLIQLETPEVSFVGSYFDRIEKNKFSMHPEASGTEPVDKIMYNYISAAYPFTLCDHNMIMSLNYQYLFDFNRHWKFPLEMQSQTNTSQEQVDYRQKGGLSAIGLAYCLQITPRISFGFTLNFWEDFLHENEWEQTTHQNGSGIDRGDAFISQSNSFDRYGFSGFNANLGTMFNITDKFTIGAVFKTPFTADLRHEHQFDAEIKYPDLPDEYNYSYSNRSTTDEELDMPMSYGIGFSYRFSDALTAAFDIYRTEWDDFVLKDANGNKQSPITGKDSGQSSIDPTHQLRMGAEYLFITSKYYLPLRGGVFYDPAPAEGSPDDIYGISIGSGFIMKQYKQIIFDIAYQYRFGDDIGDSILKNMGFSQDIDEHMVFASVIYHF